MYIRSVDKEEKDIRNQMELFYELQENTKNMADILGQTDGSTPVCFSSTNKIIRQQFSKLTNRNVDYSRMNTICVCNAKHRRECMSNIHTHLCMCKHISELMEVNIFIYLTLLFMKSINMENALQQRLHRATRKKNKIMTEISVESEIYVNNEHFITY